MTELDQLRDNDKLVAINDVDVDYAFPRTLRLKQSGKQVYVDPDAFGVADIILRRDDLCSKARLRLHETEKRRKGTPIFGMKFSRALQTAAQAYPGTILKSMFKLTDELSVSNFGICSTLVTHFQRLTKELQMEAWQYTPQNKHTYYVHGMAAGMDGPFTHLDGATMNHCEADQKSLFGDGSKKKGSDYSKLFRLDGKIAIVDVIELVDAFMPCELLNSEYFQKTQVSTI